MKRILFLLLVVSSGVMGQSTKVTIASRPVAINPDSIKPVGVTNAPFLLSEKAKLGRSIDSARISTKIDSAFTANSFVLRNSKSSGDSAAVASGSNGFIFPKTTYSGAIQMLHSAGDTARSVIIVGKADSAATVAALAAKAATSHTHDSTTVPDLHKEAYYNTKYAPLSGGTVAGSISYDTTQTFYYDTTSGRLVVRQGLYKRRFKALDSTSTVVVSSLTPITWSVLSGSYTTDSEGTLFSNTSPTGTARATEKVHIGSILEFQIASNSDGIKLFFPELSATTASGSQLYIDAAAVAVGGTQITTTTVGNIIRVVFVAGSAGSSYISMTISKSTDGGATYTQIRNGALSNDYEETSLFIKAAMLYSDQKLYKVRGQNLL